MPVSFSFRRLRNTIPASVAGIALLMVGCTYTTTREDVADARAELEREQEETAAAIRAGEANVAEARREAFEASEPVIEQGREDVAQVERQVSDSIRQQQNEENVAATKLRTAEQQLHARQARDSYAKQVEHQLADIALEIDQLEERAANAEDAEREELDRQIEMLQAQHERAQEALEELRSAELNEWEVHQQHVRMAMQDLDDRLSRFR